jgi:hypothetical protein
MTFEHLKVGDRVDRYHGKGFFMQMQVTEVHDKTLICAAVMENGRLTQFTGWKFNRKTGAEEDAELHWGTQFGATGTYLKLRE